MKVRLKRVINDTYEIVIQPALLQDLAERLVAMFGHREAVIITDSNVAPLYAQKLEKELQDLRVPVMLLQFEAGEASKNRATKEQLEDQILKANVMRNGYIIAFGGGVTGDMAGYVAATYLRGIPFVQVPTTLLSQVDSSVGGKTGVDTPYGKNMVGAFYQPKAVFIDPEVLATLSEMEYLSGLGEVLKHALMFDTKLSRQLIVERDAVQKRDPEVMRSIVETNCAIKAKVVEKDEKEAGMRKLLNFGHTAGHAVEHASNYQFAHGLAVLQGMCMEAAIGMRAGLVDESLMRAVFDLVTVYFPVEQFFPLPASEQLIEMMLHDKKNCDGEVYFVFPSVVGKPLKRDGAYAFPVSTNMIRDGLAFFLSVCSELKQA